MTDQIPEQPRMQPEAPAHHNSPTPWVILSVVLLLVLVAGVLATYFYWPDSSVESVYNEAEQEVQCEEVCNVPFFYSDTIENGQTSIWMVDRCTGEESIAVSYQQLPIALVAAPEVNYDGRIFYSILGEGENIGVGVSELDVETGQAQEATFSSYLPSNWDAREVSQDGSKMAVVYDSPVLGDDLRSAAVIDMLTGERVVVGELANGEYYSRYRGDNTMGGASGFTIEWLSDECFQVAIYTDPSENFHGDSADEKELDRYERYCME